MQTYVDGRLHTGFYSCTFERKLRFLTQTFLHFRPYLVRGRVHGHLDCPDPGKELLRHLEPVLVQIDNGNGIGPCSMSCEKRYQPNRPSPENGNRISQTDL